MTLRTIDSKEVSKICLGTMTWGQQNTEAEAHEQISYALDRGINMLDAAEMYPVPPRAETQGRTEEYIGTWFKKTGLRDKYVLATKAAGAIDEHSFTNTELRECIEMHRDLPDLWDLAHGSWEARFRT